MAAWGPVAEILMGWAVWASGALKALRWFEEVANTENGIQIGTVYSVLVTGGVHRQCLQWGLAQAFESLVETKETSCEKDVASQSLPFSKEPCNNSFKTTVWGKIRPPESRGRNDRKGRNGAKWGEKGSPCWKMPVMWGAISPRKSRAVTEVQALLSPPPLWELREADPEENHSLELNLALATLGLWALGHLRISRLSSKRAGCSSNVFNQRKYSYAFYTMIF